MGISSDDPSTTGASGTRWLWPFRIPVRIATRVGRSIERLQPLTSGRRYILFALLTGGLPLLASFAAGVAFHQWVSTLLFFPLFVSLVYSGRFGAAMWSVLCCYGAHSALALYLSYHYPTEAAAVLTGGLEYWNKNIYWIQTGIDPEYNPANWMPAQLLHLVSISFFSYTSLGLIPFFHGFYEVDVMNFYVGRLMAQSESKAVALLFGWHCWSVCRGIAYAIIIFFVATLSVERFFNLQLISYLQKKRILIFGLLFCLMDFILKFFMLDLVRNTLFANLVNGIG